METDLTVEGAVGLELGLSITAGLVHLVIAVPDEIDGVGITGFRRGSR